MTFLFRQLFKLIYLLNSETGTRSIAAGCACGLVLGFSPVVSLQGLLVVAVVLFFRVQIGAAMLSSGLFKFVALLMTGVFHWIGDSVLSVRILEPVYTLLYNLPLIPYTRFYNTVVMGAGVVSLILVVPVYLITCRLVDQYRGDVLRRLKTSRYWSLWKSTSLYKWYRNYESTMS
ncbi:MAG: TIGR03546 family protein [bacterium]